MTFFSRLVLTGSLLLSVAFLSGCQSPDRQTEIFPTVGNPGANLTVATFHVGDSVTVTLQGPENEPPPHLETIDDQGNINMPEIGTVKAVGETSGQVEKAIHDLYVPKYYNQLTVSITSGDRVYYVRGEVKQPGRILYLGETTVTKAIAGAGDFSDFANRHNVTLTRGKHKLKVDCAHIFDHPEDDPLVYPGDLITVHRRFT